MGQCQPNAWFTRFKRFMAPEAINALGRRVGNNFGQKDRREFGTALESNSTGNTSNWTNPDTNSDYSVTPTRTYQQGDRPCREFTMNANVNGKPEKVTGTA